MTDPAGHVAAIERQPKQTGINTTRTLPADAAEQRLTITLSDPGTKQSLAGQRHGGSVPINFVDPPHALKALRVRQCQEQRHDLRDRFVAAIVPWFRRRLGQF